MGDISLPDGLAARPAGRVQGADVLQALTESPPATRSRPASRLSATPGFGAWLDARAGFFAVSTLTSEMLLFIAGNGAGGVSAGGRNFGFTRGVSADHARMWVAGNTRLFHLVNQGPRTVGAVDHDAVYVPQRAYFVGDSLLHDVVHAVTLGGERNEVVFVNTSYSVIATIDQDHSFRPLWKPKHISRLVPEDRCHLNCVALRGDRVAYASMFSLTDTAQGWREAGPGSGVIVDIASHEVVCAGLEKPHSLRWHRDRLWVLDSRAGDFGYVDEQRGRFVVVKHLGNYLRGLVMIGDYAVIGATATRGEPLKHEPSIPGFTNTAGSLHASALYVVDLRSGEVVHALMMTGINGVYDVAFVSGSANPLVPKFGSTEEDVKWTSFTPDISALSCSGGTETMGTVR